MDPEIDFAAIMDQFDTLFIGRRTFELMIQSAKGLMPGMRTFVFSRTLPQAAHPDVTIVAEKPEELVTRLRAMPGKDIWLFGGANCFPLSPKPSLWTRLNSQSCQCFWAREFRLSRARPS